MGRSIRETGSTVTDSSPGRPGLATSIRSDPEGKKEREREERQMVAVVEGKMLIKIEQRFGISEAQRVRDTVERIAPVREVVIDFSGSNVEDAALLVVADLIKSNPACRVRLGGLSRHRRRLLRYMGAPESAEQPAPGDAGAGEPAAAA
jgi:hypothetical protein